MKNVALIFAGGTGQRMGSEIPKQFLKVFGKEIIIHTLELFEVNKDIDQIYVACIEDWIPQLKKLINMYDIDKVARVFPGGATGQDTIFIGLSEIKKDYDDAIVLIHDGVRPLVNQETISRVIESTKKYGSGVPVNKCFETPIVSLDGENVNEMPDRRNVYLAQAPQAYYLKQILETHIFERKCNPTYDGIVDSCGLMFKHGFVSHMVEGNRGNIKVTTPDDFYALLSYFNVRDYEQISNLNKNNLNKKKE